MAFESPDQGSFSADGGSSFAVPEQVFRSSPLFLGIALVTAFGCFAAASMNFYCFIEPFGKDPPPPGVAFGAGVAFALGGLVMIGYTLWYRDLTYMIFPDGVARVYHGRRLFWRWDEIEAIWEARTRPPIHWWIETKAGAKYHVKYTTKRVWALGRALQSKMVAHRLPSVMKEFESGNLVSFGPVEISKSCLFVNGNQLEWCEVKSASLNYLSFSHGYHLQVRQKGSFLPWCSVPSVKIPNLAVFEILLNQVQLDKFGTTYQNGEPGM